MSAPLVAVVVRYDQHARALELDRSVSLSPGTPISLGTPDARPMCALTVVSCDRRRLRTNLNAFFACPGDTILLHVEAPESAPDHRREP